MDELQHAAKETVGHLDSVVFLAAVLGGGLDYARQIQTGERTWSWWAFFLHMSLAVFFGWLVGLVALGFGYSSEIAVACGGLGGFMGVRVSDVIYLIVGKKAGAQ